jgi:hypothetical protein
MEELRKAEEWKRLNHNSKVEKEVQRRSNKHDDL